MLQTQRREIPVTEDAPLSNRKALLDHPAYLEQGICRIQVPADKVPWEVDFPEYELIPQDRFDHPRVLAEYAAKGEKGWAAAPTARAYADTTKSYVAELPRNTLGEALNPGGRTGIRDGRGLLGNPGPNFAADPIIFRCNPESGSVEVLLIERKDTKEWALPGGMTDFGELASATLQRELQEETGFALSMEDAAVVYSGYVDDPRNTDKAWMETVAAVKFLSDREGKAVQLMAGDDAGKVQWRRVDRELLSNLYGSHGYFIRLALAHVAK